MLGKEINQVVSTRWCSFVYLANKVQINDRCTKSPVYTAILSIVIGKTMVITHADNYNYLVTMTVIEKKLQCIVNLLE